MQPGERASIDTSVRNIGGNGKKPVYVVVLRIGLYTTVELTVDQALALHANLERIRGAWYRERLDEVDQAISKEEGKPPRTVLASKG